MTTPLIPTASGLSFPAAIASVFKKYATFSGRATRSEYWWWMLFHYLVQIALSVFMIIGMVISAASAIGNSNWTQPDNDMWVPQGSADPVGMGFFFFGLVLLALWALATIIPTLAVTVRRLHDAGYTGWLILLELIPFGAVVVFIFTVLPSQQVNNKWGAAPLRAGAAAAA